MTNCPLVRMPLPASGNHCQSLPVCAPYLAIEKPGQLAAARTDLRDPLDQRDRQHRLRVRGARVGDEACRRAHRPWRCRRRCFGSTSRCRGCRRSAASCSAWCCCRRCGSAACSGRSAAWWSRAPRRRRWDRWDGGWPGVDGDGDGGFCASRQSGSRTARAPRRLARTVLGYSLATFSRRFTPDVAGM